MKLLEIAYRYLPKSLINQLGSMSILKSIRDRLIRPKGVVKTTQIKVHWGAGAFDFIAPIKMAVKAREKGIENTLLRTSLKILKLLDTKAYSIMDIGANYGFISLALYSNLNASTKIVAFEPHPEIANNFKESVRVNGFDTIRVENLAVGNSTESLTLNLYGQTSNIHTLEVDPSSTVAIDQVTVDSYITQNNFKPDFVKIDVDGYELNVLEGMRKTFQDCAPIIVIETNDNIDIISWFKSIEYTVLDMELKEPGATIPANIFCFPKNHFLLDRL